MERRVIELPPLAVRGDFIAIGQGLVAGGEFLVAGYDDAGGHIAQFGIERFIVIEDEAGIGAVGSFEAVFRVSADVFEHAEKKYPDFHGAVATTLPCWCLMSPALTPVTSVTRIRARYSETDQMGVVYHELSDRIAARGNYCRTAGFRYRDLEGEHGILLAVTEVDCRYLSPARYDDEVEIVTLLTRVNYRALTLLA